MFVRKQALEKNVHAIDFIYSFQVLIIIELSFNVLCQGVVLVGESRFVLWLCFPLVRTTGFDYYCSCSSSSSVDRRTWIRYREEQWTFEGLKS